MASLSPCAPSQGPIADGRPAQNLLLRRRAGFRFRAESFPRRLHSSDLQAEDQEGGGDRRLGRRDGQRGPETGRLHRLCYEGRGGTNVRPVLVQRAILPKASEPPRKQEAGVRRQHLSSQGRGLRVATVELPSLSPRWAPQHCQCQYGYKREPRVGFQDLHVLGRLRSSDPGALP
jgi:hypothetical protein